MLSGLCGRRRASHRIPERATGLKMVSIQRGQLMIANIAGTKKAARAFLLGSAAFGLAVPAAAQAESGSLEQQLRALQYEVQELKERQERDRVSAPANAVTGGDIPGSFKLPGTDTSIAIGGYAKGDVILNIDQDLGDTFAVGGVQPDGASEDTTFRLHGKETRINFTTHTPTEFGVVRGFIEGDFFGSAGNENVSNSDNLRVRHAYGEFGPLLVGQTWTLFMPLTSYPDTVDFHGPQGISFIRQGQIRYTHQVNPNLSIAVSAENPQLFAQSFDGGAIGSRNPSGIGLDRLPDFVGALQYDDDSGIHFKLAGLARLLDVDGEVVDVDGNPTGVVADDDEFAWGLMAAASVPVAPTTTLNGNFAWGDGIGRYILGEFQAPTDAFINDQGRIQSIEAWGFAGSINHAWTNQVASNFVYGIHNISDTFFAGSSDRLQSFHVNTWWSPVDQARFGIEYMHGRRDFDNRDGVDRDNTANRVQFAAQYFF